MNLTNKHSAVVRDPAGKAVRKRGTAQDLMERDDSDAKVAASELRFRRLFEAAKDGILILNAESGVILDANPFLAELLGYTVPELVGQKVWELGSFRDIAANQEAFLELQRAGYVRYDDLPMETKSGGLAAVEFISNVYDAGGSQVIQCNIRDISERKTAAKDLRQSEAWLNEAQHTAQIGSWRYLPDGALTWSDEMYALYRIPRDVPPTHAAILAVIHPDDRASRDQAALARTIDSGAAGFEIDYRVVWPDGEIRNLCSRATLHRDADGKLIDAVGTVQDVTDRTNSEGDRAELAAIVASSDAAIISFCTAGIILSWNKGAELQYGYTAAEIIGKPVDLLMPPEQLQERSSFLASLRAGKSVSLVNATRVRKDGAHIKISGSLSPVRNAHGKVTGGSKVSHDISAQKNAERSLRRSEANMADAQRIAHLGSWETDLATKAVTWSTETYRIFGLAPETGMTHELFLQAVHPDDRAKVEKAFAECGTGEQDSCAIAHRLLLPGGQLKFVEERWQVTRGADGTPRRATGTCQDVTEERTTAATLRATIESALDCIVTMDEAGTILEFNPAAERTFGLSRADAINQPLATTIIPPRYREGHLRGMKAFTESEQTVITGKRIEVAGLRADGSEFPMELTVCRIGDGRPAMFTAFMRDITEKRRAELERDQFFTLSLDLMCIARTDGFFHRLNPAFQTTLGFTEEELLQRPFVDFIHPDDVAATLAVVETLKAGIKLVNFENRYRCKDGSYRHFLWSCTPDPSGMLYGTARDITERKAAEEALREQAEMLNLAQDAIAIRGYDDRLITYWNQGAERLYGWTSEEAIGQPVDFLYDGRGDNEAAKQMLEASGEFQGEVRQIAKDGRSVIVNVRANVMRNSDGTPRSVLSIATDMTEHKKLESQFLRAQRLESIGTLASGVAHDLNNILSPILMSVPLLRTPLSDEGREKLLSLVEQSAERGASIVKQVLTFARGADGEKVLLQPAYLVKEITQIAQETFPNNVTVRSEYPDDLWLISGDATELHQVLLNLCVNARDAMPAGGSLSINAENLEVDAHYASMIPGAQAGPHVLLTVSDTGTGIPPAIIEKIFDPFFTTKGEGKGTGLGLSTVLGIVKNHDGVVNAYSTARGTTFRVVLPAAPGMHQASTGAAPADLPRGRGETILIVDDEPIIREVAQALLAQSGYIVLTADDGPAALAIFARRSAEICLVLTDFTMPLMSGMTLARALRKMNASTKIIISTGRDEDCNPTEAKAIGIEATLAKPYTQEKLLRTLDRLLHAGTPDTS